jgi:glycosyltransferase involved in cell wall biosynthesis
MDFRQDLPRGNDMVRLRARTRNAMLLLDLDNCDAGYSPTGFQRSRLPEEYQAKVRTIFDGIDTDFWQPRADIPRQVMGIQLPEDKKIVTYVSRGMESMRGFDRFLRLAVQVRDARDDVIFIVVGEDRVAYGGDENFTEGKSFKDWVVAQMERERNGDSLDLERIGFLGRIPAVELARLFALTDLHLYWTVPFVLSWSMMDALACGALVAGSDTPPVREMIRHEENGLLFDFFDTDRQFELVNRVLDDLPAYRPMAEAGRRMIRDQYAMDVCLPRLLELYTSVAGGSSRI